MKLQAVENLKAFTHTRPPVVVFMVCMGLFAVALLTLSIYVENNQIRNPDVSQDWNRFLDTFAMLEFCLLENSTEIIQTTSSPKTPSTVSSRVQERSAGEQSPSTEPPLVGNYSVPMLVEIRPTRDFLTIPHNVTHLSGTLSGSDIGLKGSAREESINITMEIMTVWNSSHCSPYHGGCAPVKILTCVSFQAQSYVFPATKSPGECTVLNETSVVGGNEYSAQIRSHVKDTMSPYFCRGRPVITLKHELDAALSVWLSMHDKSVINLHLLHTSYFLFVMVIMLFCYALVRGRAVRTNGNSELLRGNEA